MVTKESFERPCSTNLIVLDIFLYTRQSKKNFL